MSTNGSPGTAVALRSTHGVGSLTWELPTSRRTFQSVFGKIPGGRKAFATARKRVACPINEPYHAVVFGTTDPRQVANAAKFLALVMAKHRTWPVALLDITSGGGTLAHGYFKPDLADGAPTLDSLIEAYTQDGSTEPRMLSVIEMARHAYATLDKLVVFAARDDGNFGKRLSEADVVNTTLVVDNQFPVQVHHAGTHADEVTGFTFKGADRLVLVMDLSQSSREKLVKNFMAYFDGAQRLASPDAHATGARLQRLIADAVLVVNDINGESGVRLDTVVEDMRVKWSKVFGGNPAVFGIPTETGMNNQSVVLARLPRTAEAWVHVGGDLIGRFTGPDPSPPAAGAPVSLAKPSRTGHSVRRAVGAAAALTAAAAGGTAGITSIHVSPAYADSVSNAGTSSDPAAAAAGMVGSDSAAGTSAPHADHGTRTSAGLPEAPAPSDDLPKAMVTADASSETPVAPSPPDTSSRVSPSRAAAPSPVVETRQATPAEASAPTQAPAAATTAPAPPSAMPAAPVAPSSPKTTATPPASEPQPPTGTRSPAATTDSTTSPTVVNEAPPVADPAPSQPQPVTAEATKTPVMGRNFVIVKGDSLSEIAMRALQVRHPGRAVTQEEVREYYLEIFKIPANHPAIGRTPDNIYAGGEIFLPEFP